MLKMESGDEAEVIAAELVRETLASEDGWKLEAVLKAVCLVRNLSFACLCSFTPSY